MAQCYDKIWAMLSKTKWANLVSAVQYVGNKDILNNASKIKHVGAVKNTLAQPWLDLSQFVQAKDLIKNPALSWSKTLSCLKANHPVHAVVVLHVQCVYCNFFSRRTGLLYILDDPPLHYTVEDLLYSNYYRKAWC